jgi:hypothetical protein
VVAAAPLPAARSALRLATVALALVGGLVLAARSRWLCDDIFITFRYADHILAGHGAVFNDGERVEGFTHPLWLALVTLWRLVGGAPEPFVIALGLAAYAGVILACGLRRTAFPLAAILLALNHDFRIWATSGLETMAFTLSVVLAVFALIDRRWRIAGVALSVAVLLRPDGLVFCAVALVWAWFEKGRERAFVLLPLLVYGAYAAWRLYYYGDLLPNPYYAKSAGRSYWGQGAFYVWSLVRIYWSSFLCLLALPVVRRRDVGLPLSFALAYLVLFVARVGGDFIYARFMIPVVPLLYVPVENVLKGRLAPIAAAAAAALLLFDNVRQDDGWAEGGHRHTDLVARGIVDEYWYYTRDVGGMNHIQQARVIGTALRRYQQDESMTVLISGQNALAYYARFPVAIEATGLTDRTIARSALEQRGRPGHEKSATLDYLRERRVDFVFARPPLDPASRRVAFAVGDALFPAEVVTETGLVERLLARYPHEFFVLPATASARLDR